jgi:hypothetical protein
MGGCGLVPTTTVSPTASVATRATSGGPTSVQVGLLVVPAVIPVADRISPNVDCASVIRRFTATTGEYAAAALIAGCLGTTDTPLNGDHGFYPKPPATARTEQVQTPVGTATVFSNQYSECTSSCYMGADEVALLTVDGATVQIMAVSAPASGTRERSRADLIALLQTLGRA